MIGEFAFFIGVSALLMHEMDAIDKKEWRLLFVLRRLPDDGAMRWFVVLHLPLFVALLTLVAAGPSSVVQWLEGVVAGFLIVHAALHERLARRGARAFANPFSRAMIWSAGVLGAVHLTSLVSGA